MVYIPNEVKRNRARTKRLKYGNRKVVYQGKKFDSIGERDRFIFLQDMQRNGVISGLRCQVSFDLVVNGLKVCRYVADFVYEHDGQEVVEDYKGFRTATFNLKEKLMLAVHGIKIRVVKSPSAVIG